MTDNMTTEGETTQEQTTAPAPAAAPAVPEMTAADDRALRRIGYILGGATVVCAGMGIYTGFVAPTARSEFNPRAEVSRRAVQPATTYSVRVSSAQFTQQP